MVSVALPIVVERASRACSITAAREPLHNPGPSQACRGRGGCEACRRSDAVPKPREEVQRSRRPASAAAATGGVMQRFPSTGAAHEDPQTPRGRKSACHCLSLFLQSPSPSWRRSVGSLGWAAGRAEGVGGEGRTRGAERATPGQDRGSRVQLKSERREHTGGTDPSGRTAAPPPDVPTLPQTLVTPARERAASPTGIPSGAAGTTRSRAGPR